MGFCMAQNYFLPSALGENKPVPANFEAILEESVRLHGHLCPGQVLGVRLSLLGLALLGVSEPKGKDRKSFMVYVEIDRCATDAIQSVTGCSLGKRSLRWVDLGKMAATFVRLPSGEGYRIVAREDARELAEKYCPHIAEKYARQREAYKLMSEDELFWVQKVSVKIPEQDLPGRPLKRIQCAECGEFAQDMRDVEQDGRLLCKSCAFGAYYETKD